MKVLIKIRYPSYYPLSPRALGLGMYISNFLHGTRQNVQSWADSSTAPAQTELFGCTRLCVQPLYSYVPDAQHVSRNQQRVSASQPRPSSGPPNPFIHMFRLSRELRIIEQGSQIINSLHKDEKDVSKIARTGLDHQTGRINIHAPLAFQIQESPYCAPQLNYPRS